MKIDVNSLEFSYWKAFEYLCRKKIENDIGDDLLKLSDEEIIKRLAEAEGKTPWNSDYNDILNTLCDALVKSYNKELGDIPIEKLCNAVNHNFCSERGCKNCRVLKHRYPRPRPVRMTPYQEV